MIAFHMKKLGYSISEMARLLHLKGAEFESMYCAEMVGEPPLGGRPVLRVVK
jgi:hypothetical protein